MNTTSPTPAPVTNVMLDIETYGLTPGSVIKSIGAVKFGMFAESGHGKILDRFYRRVDAQSCVRWGLTLDASTVEWWLSQSEEARKEMTLPGENIRDVIVDFETWVGEGEVNVWGNGAAYDNVLVAAAASAVGRPVAWAHKYSLCYRTVKNANKDLPIDAFRVRTHHNAMDDAESQALHLMAIWARDAKRLQDLDVLRVGITQALAALEQHDPGTADAIRRECKYSFLD